ncbi:MAG: DUF4340 domain-containing protein [Planctomycetes bacterium]|nr:DUF4340 domain-containing protein [Planctomycetota bacterium]
MNFRTTLILAVLAVVAAGTVLLIKYKMPADTGDDTKGGLSEVRAFAGLSTPDVTRIEIDRQGALGRIVLEQADQNWRLAEPVAAKARYTQATLLARLLAELTYDRTVKVGSPALDSAKLNPPEAAIKFTARMTPKDAPEGAEPQAVTYELAVGRQTGLGTDRYVYVQVKGRDVVYLVKGELHDVVLAALDEFRDRNVFGFGPGRVEKLTLIRGDQTVAAERAGEDAWMICEPVRARGDREAITSLLTTITTLNVDDFVGDASDDDSRYGLDKPRLTVVLQEKSAAPVKSETAADEKTGEEAEKQPESAAAPVVHTLIVGANADLQGTKVYARLQGQPSVFTIKDRTVRDLQKEVFDLRDRRGVPLDQYRVDHLALDLDGSAVALDRTDGTWTIAVPEKAPAEGQVVQTLLENMAGLKISKFVDNADPKSAELGFDKPYGTITFRHRGDVKDTSIVVGREVASGEMWLLDVADNVAGKVDAADVVRLKRTWLDLHRLNVWTIGGDQTVRSVSWTRDGETVELTNSGTNEKPEWRIVQPIEAAADVEKVTDLVAQVHQVEAVRYMARADKAADFGLDKPQIRLTVKAEAAGGETSEYTLLIAERDSKYVAMTAGGSLIFGLDKSLVEGLAAPLEKQQWAAFDKDQVNRLEVRGPHIELNLNRSGDEWSADNAAGFSVNSMRVRWLLSDLAAIDAERIVRYKTEDLTPYGLDKPEWRLQVKGLTVDRTFLLGSTGPGGRYATIEGSGRVVLLSLKDVEKIAKDKSYYEAAR